MGTLMQMLLEALRANAEERNNGAPGGQQPDEMSGFILENVQVATMPYIDYEGETEVNPLVQFAYNKEEARGGRNPQNMSNILDHLVRLEEKVKVLEQCIPPKSYRQRIWLAPGLSDPHGDEGSGYSSEDEPPEEEPYLGAEKGSGPSRSPASGNQSGSGGRSGHRVTAAPPIRLEKEERSCFARLLFSRCWTAKDDGAGWRVKRHCPTHGSLSCPCGNIGPCKNVKKNACPVDQLKSTKPKKKQNKNKNGPMTVSEGATFTKKAGRGGTHSKLSSSSKVSRKISKTNGKPLIGKLLPCCFKDHTHTECCCRCKDNPKLSTHKQKYEKSMKKNSKSLRSEPKATEEDTDQPSEEASDYYDDYDDDNPERVQAFNVQSLSDFSKLKRDYVGSSRKRPLDGRIPSKRKTGNKKNLYRVMKDPKSKSRSPENSNSAASKPVKSTTSFQITLHPVLSEGELPEPEVVRHQILKTLSTIHGPMKVEQKIVVQGTKNSVVIVTHGEACQCNLCHMLKGKLNHNELVEGSPQVVKISTSNGCNMLINHSDGCKCDLCGVLDPAVTNNPGKTTPRNESLIVAACSSANLKPHENGAESIPEAPTLPTTRTNDMQDVAQLDARVNEGTRTVKIHSLGKKSMCKANNAGKKVKRCRCTKCRQRRRVERLKLRLKKDMGSEGYERILQEITRRRDLNDRKPFVDVKPSVQSDSDIDDYVAPKKTKKSVSFSDDPDPQYYPEDEGPHLNVDERICGRKGKRLLCEGLEINDANFNKSDKRKNKIESPLQNTDSTVYSVNATSEESKHLVYGSGIPKQDGIELGSKFKPFGKGHMWDEQKCFPPKHMPGTSQKKRAPAKQILEEGISEEFRITKGGEARCTQQESGCSGKCSCRQDGDSHEGMNMEQPAILLQDGAFPPKFVYWSPGSRSNMATAHSSESYYVPDEDEFPIVNMECEESIPSSGRNTDAVPIQRVQIPVWFRMLPDRSCR